MNSGVMYLMVNGVFSVLIGYRAVSGGCDTVAMLGVEVVVCWVL